MSIKFGTDLKEWAKHVGDDLKEYKLSFRSSNPGAEACIEVNEKDFRLALYSGTWIKAWKNLSECYMTKESITVGLGALVSTVTAIAFRIHSMESDTVSIDVRTFCGDDRENPTTTTIQQKSGAYTTIISEKPITKVIIETKTPLYISELTVRCCSSVRRSKRIAAKLAQ